MHHIPTISKIFSFSISCSAIQSRLTNNQRTTSPWEKAGLGCYAKSPTELDAFWLIPGLISYARVTRRWELLSHGQYPIRWLALSIRQVEAPSNVTSVCAAVLWESVGTIVWYLLTPKNFHRHFQGTSQVHHEKEELQNCPAHWQCWTSRFHSQNNDFTFHQHHSGSVYDDVIPNPIFTDLLTASFQPPLVWMKFCKTQGYLKHRQV